MKCSVISFDVYGTLLEPSWDIGSFAVSVLEDNSIAVLDPSANMKFNNLVSASRSTYERLHLGDDLHAACEEYWQRVTRVWLDQIGLQDVDHVQMLEAAFARLYGDVNPVFMAFADVEPCLHQLKMHGFRLVALSNWDFTLPRVLSSFEWGSYFEAVLPSLVYGVEKPHPESFELMLQAMNVDAGDVVHVGDSVVDDYDGARNAQIRSILVDRLQPALPPHRIQTLDQLMGVLR